MDFEQTVEDQIVTSFFLFNNPALSWIIVLLPLIILATFFIFGSLSIFFTSIVLIILSTLLFIFSKRKLKLVEKSVKEEIHKSVHQESSPEMEAILSQNESQINTQQKQASEGEGASYQIDHGYLVRSPDVLSETECLDQPSTSTEDSEVDWPFQDNMDQSPDFSDDGSISDEDSLIEISLPGGHYVSHNMQQKLPPDFMTESIFQHRNLIELLADMYEEENLIEIDISMGSIKCSRFEIEA
ncbi:hypothetical protein DITRI_Ditri13aG0134000 [Diplodiscus trichospermus]